MEAHEFTERLPAPRSVSAGAVARRAFDIAVSLILLVLVAPLLIAIAVTICLESSGPALFRQRRVGAGGREFTVNKFRTMHADSDAKPHREYVRALIRDGGPGLVQGDRRRLYKLAVDHRVTRVGRFLRRFSLDELPQFWNVLKGDMSLVGPRPVIPYEVENYPPGWSERFSVKPGVTGLWQVSGRNERTYAEMVRFDIEYARSRSFWLDLKILVKTAWVVLHGKGVA